MIPVTPDYNVDNINSLYISMLKLFLFTLLHTTYINVLLTVVLDYNLTRTTNQVGQD